MRVGVDATSWVNRRGYGRFARNALPRLVEADGSDYVFFVEDESRSALELPPRAEVRPVTLGRRPTDAASAHSGRPIRDLARLARAVARERLDVFLFPSVYTWFPVVRTPTVVGVHDLIADQLPELTLVPGVARLRWRLKRSAAIRTARRIFTVSETSRSVLSRALRIAPQRIAIVPEAPDPVFRPRTRAEIEAALASVGLDADTPFVLYAGGISPHKSLETLLEAYARVANGAVAAAPLAIVGALEDEAYLSAAGGLRRRIAQLGLESRVRLPGYVADDTLACLYSATAVMVSPSLSEGFGLPPVEAAACGSPVVLSDIPAHRESLGEAASYFPVRDDAALAAHLERLLGDAGLRARLGEAARARVAPLTWEAAGRSLQAVLVEAARG